MVGLSSVWPRFAAYSEGRSDFCSAYKRSVSTLQLPLIKRESEPDKSFHFTEMENTMAEESTMTS